MITKIHDKLDYEKLSDKTYSVSCWNCRNTLWIGNIEKGLIESKCKKCGRFTTVVAEMDY